MFEELSLTLIIIIITVISSFLAFNDKDLQYKLMMSPYQVKHHKEWHRLITHAFVHKDYLHLFMNMYVMYLFGKEGFGLEKKFTLDFGSAGLYYFGLLYFGGFLFATLPSMKRHGDNPNYLSLGASGAVSAVVFSTIVLFPTQGIGLIFIPGIFIPAFIFGFLYLSYEMYMDKRGGTGVAHDAHLWGALYGVIYTFLLHPDYLKEFVAQVKNAF